MIFRRLVLCALFVGTLAGLFLSLIQQAGVLPVIVAAEVFESAGEPPEASDHSHGAEAPGHHHDAAWAPEDGAERQTWTVIANILAASGFALLLVPAITAWEAAGRRPRAGWRSGLAWGAAGWVCVFAVPALGLPPEIPGAAAASLGERQAWWLLAVVCAAIALGGFALLRGLPRWGILAVVALPFVIGAPHLPTSAFAGYPADVAAQMEALATRFAVVTAITNAAYWLVLGALAGAAVARWLRPALPNGPASLAVA